VQVAAESLATQTLVIFAVRTRRSPFTRSRPGRPLLLAALALGVALAGLVRAAMVKGPASATEGCFDSHRWRFVRAAEATARCANPPGYLATRLRGVTRVGRRSLW